MNPRCGGISSIGGWIAARYMVQSTACAFSGSRMATNSGKSGYLGSHDFLEIVRHYGEMPHNRPFVTRAQGLLGDPQTLRGFLTASTALATPILLLFVSGLALRFGTLSNAIRYQRGCVISACASNESQITPPLAGQSVEIPVTIENLTDIPVTIQWIRTGCSACVSVDTLPVTLASRSGVTLQLELTTNASDAGQTLTRVIEFCTSPGGTASVLSIAFDVSHVVAPSPVLTPEPDAHFTAFDEVREQ